MYGLLNLSISKALGNLKIPKIIFEERKKRLQVEVESEKEELELVAHIYANHPRKAKQITRSLEKMTPWVIIEERAGRLVPSHLLFFDSEHKSNIRLEISGNEFESLFDEERLASLELASEQPGSCWESIVGKGSLARCGQ